MRKSDRLTGTYSKQTKNIYSNQSQFPTCTHIDVHVHVQLCNAVCVCVCVCVCDTVYGHFCAGVEEEMVYSQ